MIQSIRRFGGCSLSACAPVFAGACLVVLPVFAAPFFVALALLGPVLAPSVLAATADEAPPYAALQAVRPLAIPKAADRRLEVVLAAHRGRPVLINFWASWCKPCREEIPALQRLSQRLGPRGLVVLTVAVADSARVVNDLLEAAAATVPDASALNAERPAPLPVLQDRDQVLGRAWGASMLPTTVVLDRRHRVVLRAWGAVDWDAPDNDKHLIDLTP